MIGITMRMMRDPATGEIRDALAHDWGRFLSILLGGDSWVMLPNIGGSCPGLARDLGVDALILTGGDGIGETPERDATETALLRHAAAEGMPVLGVCRGMQMIQCFFGGGLRKVNPGLHVRARHALAWLDGSGEDRREVNSFHNNGLDSAGMPPDLEILARCEADGSVEAVGARELPWLGLMWHPEREWEPHPADLRRIRRLLRRTDA